MSASPRFALVPLASLRAHEEVDPAVVDRLVEEIRTAGVFVDPIWIDGATGTILNGHHRFRALQRLGAVRVPAWVFDYLADESIRVEPWSPGTPVSKEAVLRRARDGPLYPIKTTRHRLLGPLPVRTVPLAELFDNVPEREPPASIRAGGRGTANAQR
ncbi:MAG: ParB N-terminal domain-containing protein [Thermoplasmata archaeon]